MTTLCDTCIVRGDFARCQSTRCNLHESWYAQQLALKLEAAKGALQFYADGKHYDTVAMEDHPVTGLKHTRLLDNGGIAEEVLRWIAEAEDASAETPVIDEKHLTVDYQTEEDRKDQSQALEDRLREVAQRLMTSLGDSAVWTIGYTVGTEPPTLIVYREPSLLKAQVPELFEGYHVQLHVASRPVVLTK